MLRIRRPSRGAFFATLMTVAALLALSPPALARWMRGAIGPLAMLQRPLALAVQQAKDAATPGRAGLSAEEAQRWQIEMEQLRRLAGNQQLSIEELERKLAEVSLLREQFGDARVKLIVAEVIGYDAAPRRATIRLSQGSWTVTGLRPDLWVAATDSPPWYPEAERVREGLSRQWLVGRVTEVQPFVTTVQLTTDPGFGPIEVQPALVGADGRWSAMRMRCALRGVGGGRMWMDRVPQELASGETIVFAPSSELLPIPMALGRISEAERIPNAPQHFNYTVMPWARGTDLRFVYIVVPAHN
ncbi:MAG: hypothetical protein IPM64_04200 [Phycisphaerales bacterium]|nr:hypothetical protein [Phycisphaerales bacterium]